MTAQSKKPQIVLPTIGTILLLSLVLLLWTSHKRHTSSTWVATWLPEPSFQIPRRALAAAASATHVYIVGGMDNDNQYVAQVEYAPIHNNGTLGHWQFTRPLNEPRFYLAAAVLNNYLYAVGGANGKRGQENIPSATVERAAIMKDGSLGPWQYVSYLTTPRRGLQAAVYHNHIYAIGGYNGIFLKSVERADINEEGSLSDWHVDHEKAVVDRYIHSAASFGDKLYLLGGHEQNPEAISYGDVEMSQINKDGNLLPWEIQKTVLKTPRFIAAAFAMKHFIYILGGHNGRNRLRSVEMAPLDTQGHVGAWGFTTSLRYARSAPALAVHDKYVYVFGGMGTNGALNSVEMATQRDNGQLGHWEFPGKDN